MIKPYFRSSDGPKPLSCKVERRIRFEEVDPLGIVWHGRYPSYFEDARVALGDSLGIGYMDFYKQGIVTPIKQMHVDYIKPLEYGDTCSVEALLHWSEAAKLSYEFYIRNEQDEVVTRGYSVLLMVTLERELLVTPPDFYQGFLSRWSSGAL
ncbi:acyl-CoA thioesterase [Halodesulfovibrio marinisediminis]|uniref:Acyl-CoA thioester hydrolase n=1 Tax=Halodesulfovibrio marinisediminis DSM 17456 TaxID=1121457 RepID=A0A1N6EBW7_9BACT|nr:acyl-CoA thioesterase [Halodesulfovibrio marinisediminis]SIN80519.1 acyl-CoA thioester hydrolase [Halodesulfovibrio marinisediminis DSM 17456]